MTQRIKNNINKGEIKMKKFLISAGVLVSSLAVKKIQGDLEARRLSKKAFEASKFFEEERKKEEFVNNIRKELLKKQIILIKGEK